MAVSSLRKWTFPPELWLMVFRDFNDSDPDSLQARDTLKSISLTCRDFRRFALPLLCETFVLNPSRNSMPFSDRTDREFRRLDFYASDRIAPYVCHLKVLHDKPQILFRKFFDMLPQFTNARSLTCNETVIDLRTFENLSALPCLQSIDLTNCLSTNPLSRNDSLRLLRLHTLRYTSDWCDADYTRKGPYRWLTLMDPSSLQVLDVYFMIPRNSPAPSSGGFFRDMPSAGLFPSLHTLSLGGAPDMVGQIGQILSNTPALRRLTISPHYLDVELINTSESPAGHLVPYLEAYDGPIELLPNILHRSGSSMKSPSSIRLRRLKLKGDNSLHAVVNTLRSLCPTQFMHLTHFHASLTWADCNTLGNVCVLFPELQELRLTPKNLWRPFTYNVGLLFPAC